MSPTLSSTPKALFSQTFVSRRILSNSFSLSIHSSLIPFAVVFQCLMHFFISFETKFTLFQNPIRFSRKPNPILFSPMVCVSEIEMDFNSIRFSFSHSLLRMKANYNSIPNLRLFSSKKIFVEWFFLQFISSDQRFYKYLTQEKNSYKTFQG